MTMNGITLSGGFIFTTAGSSIILGALSLSATTFTVGTPSSGTITGATAGSTITPSGLPTGLTINGAARTWSYDGSGSATTGSLTLTESLAGASNTPRPTPIAFTVNGSAPLDFIWYGQSNSLNHTLLTPSAGLEAAAAGTQVWDPTTSAWITPPSDGIRLFLNAMAAATGRPCRAVYGGQSGVGSSQLQKGAGTNIYENMMARVVASGINPAYIIYHQGEGDANSATSPTVVGYQTAIDTIHGSIAADTGKTKATLPMIVSGLASVTDPSFTRPDADWQTIQKALAEVNAALPNMHYSHSNMDAVLSDSVHWTPASYGRSGRRYARTVQFLMGLVTSRPLFRVTAAERVSATQTRLTVTHGMGTDFTPATGITGFRVSGNAGATWQTATGVRESATSILLTHADVGTTARNVQYQQGKNPDRSGMVMDNSAIPNALSLTTTDVVAAGAVQQPAVTYSASQRSNSSNVTQTFTDAFVVPGSTESLLALIGVTFGNSSTFADLTSVTLVAQPSGTNITATLVAAQGPNDAGTPSQVAGAGLFQAVLPSGTTGITVTVNLAANPFANCRAHVSTIPVASLNSTTPTGSGSARKFDNSGTTVSTTVTASDGGVIIAVAGARIGIASATMSITGSDTYVARHAVSFGGGHLFADAANVGAGSRTVTATFDGTVASAVAAAAYR